MEKEKIKIEEYKKEDFNTINVLYDRVLVIKEKVEKISPGGILLPTNLDREFKNTGFIVKIGEGTKDIKPPSVLGIGSKIVYFLNAGINFKYKGYNMVSLRFLDIMAVIGLDDEFELTRK